MLVMLDLDNTLADRHAAVSAWADEFSEQYELPAGTKEWILQLDRDGYADRFTVFETIRSRHGLSDSVEALLGACRSRVVELTTLTKGAKPCLKDLRDAGHHLAIVTNGSSGPQHAKIDALGLRTAVDAVVVSGDLGLEKPDAAIFATAATTVGVPLIDAWMVGDSPSNDIEGPTRLGIRTAWLHRGRVWDLQDTSPTITLDSLVDLPAAIASSEQAGT